MKQEEFEQKFRACREMPGDDDPAYQRIAIDEIVKEGNASGNREIDQNKLSAAIADTQQTEWSNIGMSPMDARLAAFSELYLEADPEQRQVLREFFDVDTSLNLVTFVGRSARILEATGDPEWIRRGLAAAGIEGARLDFRELITNLSILRYGAERASIEIKPFFDEAYEMGPPPTGDPFEFREILKKVQGYSKGTLKLCVRRHGPPEWKEEAKPWWKVW